MSQSDFTRRGFLAAAAAGVLTQAQDSGWVDLFDGKSLNGWNPSENKASWKVVDGYLYADGPRSHLFYSGPVRGAQFKNFELESEVMASPLANSGVYFHTQFQESGFPAKGFEIQVNNSAPGEGAYRERKKTGSLYGIRNLYRAMVKDNEWFTLNAAVRGKNVQIRLNGVLVVDFTEPDPPVLAEGSDRGRVISGGTFALQCHDPGSKVKYRKLRVRPLPDDTPTPARDLPVVVDDTYRQILTMGAQNYPVVDYHVHLKSGLTLEDALAKSRRDGIFYGVAVNCGKNFPVTDDAGAIAFVQSLGNQPVFRAMQAEGREWTGLFTAPAVAQFDYVFTDSMTWTDDNGKRMRLWIPAEVGEIPNPQKFMDLLVERTVGILNNEPVDIYVNPTFLPDLIAKDYDTLWTEQRMLRVIEAAKKNGVAIEINNRYRIPSQQFLKLARQNGAQFTFGTNNTGPADLKRCEYGLEMVKACNLKWQDFFVPKPEGEKAVSRKGNVLKS